MRVNPVQHFTAAHIGKLVSIQLLKKKKDDTEEVEIRSKWVGKLQAFWSVYPEMGIKLEGLDIFTVIQRSNYLEFYVHEDDEEE